MMEGISNVHESWCDIVKSLLEPHKDGIISLLEIDEVAGHHVFPSPEKRFKAFSFPMQELKVVIIGQDSYYSRAKNGLSLADGLCFSVPSECGKCPPSLKTIFNELYHEYGLKRTNTDLSDWAEQGVLMLNCALTVRENKPGSHMKVWKPFTQAFLQHLNTRHEHIVYILWGEFAKSFGSLVDKDKNKILECRHPSGLAASKGPFIGNNHFTLTNEYLVQHNKSPIKWV